MSDSGHNNGAYQLITPPNLLKAKVGNGDGRKGIDAEAIRQASEAIQSMADEFEERCTLEIAMLMKLSHDLDSDPSRAAKIASKVARVGHELSGQGATFGFEMITQVGASMCRYVKGLGSPDHLNGDVLRAHADAMRAVIKNHVKGDGGTVGAELVESLDKLVERMTAQSLPSRQ
jgi:hypothetical protein